MTNQRPLGVFLILLGAGAWGSLGLIASKLYSAGLSPLDVVTLRVTIAWLCLAVWVGLTRAHRQLPARKDWRLFFFYGAVSVALYNLLYFEAIARTGVSIAVGLLYTAPIWAAVLARMFLGECLSKGLFIILFLGIGGVLLIIGIHTQQWAQVPASGFFLGLGAGLAYALFSVFGKVALSRYDSISVLFYAFGFGALLLLVGFLANNGWSRLSVITAKDWGLLCLLGIVPTFLAYLAYVQGLRRVPTSYAVLLTTIEPVVALGLAFIWLGEMISGLQLGGMALIILSGLLASLWRQKNVSSPASYAKPFIKT